MTANPRYPWLGAIIFATMLIVTIFIISPAWQIHDDAYYAMLADGYGMLEQPVNAVPYMHPIIGAVLNSARPIGARYSYASLLIVCILLGAAVVSYRLIKDRVGLDAWLLMTAGTAPFLLLLQYTAVAGFLVACAVVLWTGRREAQPTLKEWVFGALLILLAMFFRAEMVATAAACLFPILVWDARSRGLLNRNWVLNFSVTMAGVVVLYVLASYWFADTRLVEFYRLNDPMAKLMNYGYIEAIRSFGTPLPIGITKNDITILGSWFFGDRSLMDPSRMFQLVESVPLENVIKIRFRDAITYVWSLPETIFFWFLLGALWMSLFSRLRSGLLFGIGLFVALSITSAVLLKPFPERVAGGITFGLFLLSVATTRNKPNTGGRYSSRFTRYVAFSLIAPAAFNIASDRLKLRQEAQDWNRDVKLLQAEDRVYSFVGQIPLRAGYRPFQVEGVPPRIIFLGSLYLVPEIRDDEMASGCGGFLECLASGRRTALVASQDNVKSLRILVQERYGKTLEVERKTECPSFTLYILSVNNATRTSL